MKRMQTMNEDVFRQLLGEMMRSEFAEYDNPPKWKFSLKHRLAMKRIFARYEKNVQKLKEKSTDTATPIEQYKPRLNFKQRLLLVLCIIILMTFLVGWVVVFVSKDFHGTVYRDNTLINAVNLENAPLTIEYKYTLNSVPEGFELIETDSSPHDSYSLYMNKTTNQTITLYQCVKLHFTPHINTEHHTLEEIDINGSTGLFIDLSSKTCDYSLVMWDNGDYIIEIFGDLDKESMIVLLKNNKF